MSVTVPMRRRALAAMLAEDRHPYWAVTVHFAPALLLPTVLRAAARWCRFDMHYQDQAAFDLIDILYWEADVREDIGQAAYNRFAGVLMAVVFVGTVLLDAYWGVL